MKHLNYESVDPYEEAIPSSSCRNCCRVFLIILISIMNIFSAVIPTINFETFKNTHGIIDCDLMMIISLPIISFLWGSCLIIYILLLNRKLRCLRLILLIISFVLSVIFFGISIQYMIISNRKVFLIHENDEKLICKKNGMYSDAFAFVINNSTTNFTQNNQFEYVKEQCPDIYSIFNLNPNQNITFIQLLEPEFISKCTIASQIIHDISMDYLVCVFAFLPTFFIVLAMIKLNSI